MRLLICAGGTGGGVYPALVVLQHLDVEGSIDQVLWVGSVNGVEVDLVKREGIRYDVIPAAGVHGVGWRALPGNVWQLGRGFLASRRVLRRFRPEVLFFTGGYVAVPMALAARLSWSRANRPRSVLFVPDIEPGLALKTLARFADRIAVPVEESLAYFLDHPAVSVTGYPVRSSLLSWSVEEARRVFALREDMPTLLVVGGSTGARSINQAVLQALPGLLTDMQVLHLCGQRDWAEVENARAALSPEQAARYRVYPYLHKEMGAALRVADLALSRAGASTLGEFPLFGLPAILVPYPYAWRYQWVNAQYLADRGAAEIVEDADLPTRMPLLVEELMADRGRLNRMSQSMQSLAHPHAGEAIAALLGRPGTAVNTSRM